MAKRKTKSKNISKATLYLEQNRYYLWLLEVSIIVWLAYFLSIVDLLPIKIITAHISNLVGSIILCLMLIRPKAFRTPRSVLVIWSLIGVSALNIFIEFSQQAKQAFDVKFNTPDPWDAVFGLLGAGVVMLVHQKTT